MTCCFCLALTGCLGVDMKKERLFCSFQLGVLSAKEPRGKQDRERPKEWGGGFKLDRKTREIRKSQKQEG